MRTKLSQLPAPALAGVVREKSVRAALAEITNCKYDGATMIDLHLPCLSSTDTETIRQITSASPLPILALNYSVASEGDDPDIKERERVESLLRAVEAGADGIDIQGYTFDPKSRTGFYGEDVCSFTHGNPKEIVTDTGVISKQCELIERVHSMGAEVLLSCHPGIPMSAETVVELALFLEERKPDVIKIVTTARGEDDLAESIRAMTMLKKEVKTPVTYHANGKAGMLSRIINPLLGGQIAFCVDRFHEDTVTEQLDLKTAASIVSGVRKIIL